MNAVARNLGGDKKRFDRPVSSRSNAKEQDRRVIDALTTAGFVNTVAEAFSPPSRRRSRRSRSSRPLV
jgi:ribosomal protein S19E (S16A)